MKGRNVMSTYYDFYAARVTDEDMIEAIGPYVRFGEENRLVPIVSRSRSFIHWNEFGAWVLPVSKIPEYQQEFFTMKDGMTMSGIPYHTL